MQSRLLGKVGPTLTDQDDEDEILEPLYYALLSQDWTALVLDAF